LKLRLIAVIKHRSHTWRPGDRGGTCMTGVGSRPVFLLIFSKCEIFVFWVSCDGLPGKGYQACKAEDSDQETEHRAIAILHTIVSHLLTYLITRHDVIEHDFHSTCCSDLFLFIIITVRQDWLLFKWAQWSNWFCSLSLLWCCSNADDMHASM